VTPNERFDLSGKVALVTGGSRGLGREIILGFADAGADVVVTSRNLETCQEVAALVEAKGRQALAYACHVGRWDQIASLVDAAYERFGRVDVLVNNAGVSPLYPSVVEITEQLWDSTFATNLRGPFRLAALVGTRMVSQGGGSIINVSSAASIRPTAHVVPYAAAKAGLETLATSLSLAFGPTVRVNTLMAGPYLTDITASWDMAAFRERAQHTYVQQRIGRPDEIVGAALFLASEASSFTTASTVRADGGRL
jgi:NAD(P)-dependent dehydrogenase (short-subunit alcohol dehydrogenase family)